MKAGDKIRVSTLRMLLSELTNERIRVGRDLDEEAFLTVVQRGVKQRHEASSQYRDGGREELAVKEETEATILQEYLPEPVSEEEVRTAVRELVASEGLEGPKAMGRLMGALMPRYKGRIDGRELQRIVREELG
jgi:hypothetical protein